MQIAAPAWNSRMKSRSATASMLLREIAAKPSSRATASRSMGYAAPASAALPSGITSVRSKASTKRPASRSSISK